jgi:hypothetical protein
MQRLAVVIVFVEPPMVIFFFFFYTGLQEILKDKLSEGLAKHWIVGNLEASNSSSDVENGEDFHGPEKVRKQTYTVTCASYFTHFYDLEDYCRAVWTLCDYLFFMILNFVETSELFVWDVAKIKCN